MAPRFWISVAADVADDAEVVDMADVLGEPVLLTVGRLVALWGTMAAHAPDGSVAGISDAVLEKWAGWSGERGVFATQFRSRFVEDDGVVRRWMDYNGKAIKRMQDARDRMRAHREKSKTQPTQEPTQPKSNRSHRVRKSDANGTTESPARSRNVREHSENGTRTFGVNHNLNQNQELQDQKPIGLPESGSPVVANDDEHAAQFEVFKHVMPRRDGSHRWGDAWKHWRARIREGVAPTAMLDGAARYAAFMAARGKVGTELVMQAATFLGTNREYENSWSEPPREKPPDEHPYRRAAEDWLTWVMRCDLLVCSREIAGQRIAIAISEGWVTREACETNYRLLTDTRLNKHMLDNSTTFHAQKVQHIESIMALRAAETQPEMAHAT